MERPLRIEYSGAFYHVTSRGNEQKDIFRSRRDREQFLSYLQTASERYGAVIHAYSGTRLREIGEHFGLSGAAVSEASRRLRVTGEKDAVIINQLELIRNKLEL